MLRQAVNSLAVESLPTQTTSASSQIQKGPEKGPSQNASRISMSIRDIGSTYEPDIVFPMLALEHDLLHRYLQNTRKEVAELRRRLGRKNSLEDQQERSDPDTTDAVVERYLGNQQDSLYRHLVITSGYPYPRGEKASHNSHVHNRVKGYLDAGVAVDIVNVDSSIEPTLYEVDGVHVLAGWSQEITEILGRRSYTSVSVHFLNAAIWSALEPFMPHIDVHVFIHGRETARWVRKLPTYQSGKQMEAAIEQSIESQLFWQEVLDHPYQPRSYIFRSAWWRRAVNDDLLVTIPSSLSHVIPDSISKSSDRESVLARELAILGIGD